MSVEQYQFLEVAFRLVLLVTVTAVYWSAFGWFKRHLCLSTTIRARYIVHLAWTHRASTASAFKTHSYFHLIDLFVSTKTPF